MGSPDFLFLTLFSRLLEFFSTDLCYKLGTGEVVLPGPKASAAATICVVLFVPKRTKLCCQYPKGGRVHSKSKADSNSNDGREKGNAREELKVRKGTDKNVGTVQEVGNNKCCNTQNVYATLNSNDVANIEL